MEAIAYSFFLPYADSLASYSTAAIALFKQMANDGYFFCYVQQVVVVIATRVSCIESIMQKE